MQRVPATVVTEGGAHLGGGAGFPGVDGGHCATLGCHDGHRVKEAHFSACLCRREDAKLHACAHCQLLQEGLCGVRTHGRSCEHRTRAQHDDWYGSLHFCTAQGWRCTCCWRCWCSYVQLVCCRVWLGSGIFGAGGAHLAVAGGDAQRAPGHSEDGGGQRNGVAHPGKLNAGLQEVQGEHLNSRTVSLCSTAPDATPPIPTERNYFTGAWQDGRGCCDGTSVQGQLKVSCRGVSTSQCPLCNAKRRWNTEPWTEVQMLC